MNRVVMVSSNTVAESVRKGEVIICEKTGRSKVWTIFARILNRDGVELEFVYCTICGKVYRFNAQTSNLIRHSCYVEKFANLEGGNTSRSDVKTPTPEVTENCVNNLTKLFTKWIIQDCRSFDVLENSGLRTILQEIVKLGSKLDDANINRSLSCVSQVAKNVSEIYDQCFDSVKAEIASIKDNGFGLTTDIWTDSFTKRSYIALTIHYLTNRVVTFRLLGLKSLEGENITSTDVAAKLNQILEDFDCKLTSITLVVTDGAGGRIKDIPGTQNLPCISQLLNSALLASIKDIPEVTQVINSCSNLVKFLQKMPLNYHLRGVLQTCNPARWITVYKMLKTVESNWNAIEETLQSSGGENVIVAAVNTRHLKAVMKTFQPFEAAVEILEDDSCATMHLVIVYLHDLKKSCDTNDSEYVDIDFIETLRRILRSKLGEIVTENITTLHKVAHFLYPPTNKMLRFSDKEKKLVDDECMRLMGFFFKKDLKIQVKQEPDIPAANVPKRISLFSDFVESETNLNTNEIISQELQYYKNTRVVNTADFDVFSWWEQQKDNFPLLYKLSCILLATPATCAVSRLIFTTASSLLCEKSQQQSTDADFEKIIFVNSNALYDEIESYFSV